MKNIPILFAALTLILTAGCVTQSRVASMEGHGRKEVFDAPYEAVWRAAVDAAQAGDLNVRDADKGRGYIGASRGMRLETMGENVGVWISRIGADQTQVEVVSRQAGLPLLWFKNWESQILNGIAANLTREGNYQGKERVDGQRYPAGRDLNHPERQGDFPIYEDRRRYNF
ncbi:MAG: hypothetical protein ABI042_17315 [Verrucomicrobiota bacterium]